jgi:Type ISP C-terminal specificity domain
MSVSQAVDAFRDKAHQIASLQGARAEQSLYGPFGELLHAAASTLQHPVTAIQQVGTLNLVPDYGVFRAGHIVNWVELKSPEKDLDNLRGHDLRQFERARHSLEAFVLTNGWDWRYFEEGRLVREVQLPATTLRDPAAAPSGQQITRLAALLDHALGRTPLPVGSLDEAIRVMARRAQAVRQAVELEMRTPSVLVQALYEEFRGLVYASGRHYSKTDFADAYGQTVIFGLLLARIVGQVTVSMQTAATQIGATQHPFLARCLQLLTDPGLPLDLKGPLEEAVTGINRIPPSLFQAPGLTEPLLYAYEQFFAEYDPRGREARGVYYTPPYVVSHQVAGIQRLLRDAFDATGVSDHTVNFLDPATGTGTYLLGLLTAAEQELNAAGAAADVELAALVRDRLYAFELMVGPYSVAHQRLGTFLQGHNVVLNQRLPIYLVDTIAETLPGAVQSRFGPLGNELAQERQAAEHLKRDEPVLVVLGNPPYDRIRRAQLGDQWMQGLLEDIKNRTPSGDRGNLKALYDYYIAFWRWACWLVSERQLPNGQPQSRAILAYITNRSWLLGRGFSGLRSLVSDIAREIWVLDLGGDRRTSHTRLNDNNVFDVGVGVAITFVVVDGHHSGLPTVRYRRIWGTRSEKEHELIKDFEPADYGPVARSSVTDPLVPVEWGALTESPHLEQIFTQHETGVQTSRPWLIGIETADVLDLSGPRPSGSVGEWSQLTGQEREEAFHVTRTHPRAPRGPVNAHHLRRYAYRAMDYRVLYADPAFLEWPRPTLQPTFTSGNLALVTIERGFGVGPAAFPIDALPDLHIFRGFAGARGIYPLLGAPSNAEIQQTMTAESSRPINLHPRVQQWASSVLRPPTPEAVLAYITALLNAPSYTAAFEGGLAVERPRVPLTEDSTLAQEAIQLGNQVVDAWLLRGNLLPQIRWDAGGSTAPVFGEAVWVTPDRLAIAGRYLDRVTWDTWQFEVSGYPVLQRFCRDRTSQQTSANAMEELRRVASSVQSLVHIGVALDDLLQRVLSARLIVW